jgi:hypothetical protein
MVSETNPYGRILGFRVQPFGCESDMANLESASCLYFPFEYIAKLNTLFCITFIHPVFCTTYVLLLTHCSLYMTTGQGPIAVGNKYIYGNIYMYINK